jgi:hypothetical protein
VRRRIDKGTIWTGLDAQRRFQEDYTQDERKALLSKDARRPARELSKKDEKIYEAHYEFASQCDWDTEFAFNMDNRKRGLEGGFGTDESAANWAEKQVLIFFRDLDRKIFGKASTRHGLRTNRFVVLERAEGVGWHAHGLIMLKNTGISQEMMAEEWRRHQMMRMGENEFSKRLALVRNVWDDAVWHYNEFSEPVLAYANNSRHYTIKSSYLDGGTFRISNATYMDNILN